MKIIAIISSPNRQCTAAVLARSALQAARDAGAETREIYLSDYEIEFCRGCLDCMTTGQCTFYDDSVELRQELDDCDGIMLVSPGSGTQPNARMRNFLERFGAYRAGRLEFQGKYFAAVGTANGAGATLMARQLAQTHAASPSGRAFSSGYLGVNTSPGSRDDMPGAMRMARQLGLKLTVDIWSGRTYPLQLMGTRIANRVRMRRLPGSTAARPGAGDRSAASGQLTDRGFLPA